MATCHIFPFHPYSAYSLNDVDAIGRRLPDGWSLSSSKTWKDRQITVSVVEIWGPDGLWHIFTKPDDQWLVVTDDGTPFDFFESELDLKVAIQEMNAFVRNVATNIATANE